MEDKTQEIFDEVYSEEFIAQLIIDTVFKYPWMDADDTNIRELAILEEKMRRYYSQDSSIISSHMLAQYQDNKDKNYSNE